MEERGLSNGDTVEHGLLAPNTLISRTAGAFGQGFSFGRGAAVGYSGLID
jgi:hypothetical protein